MGLSFSFLPYDIGITLGSKDHKGGKLLHLPSRIEALDPAPEHHSLGFPVNGKDILKKKKDERAPWNPQPGPLGFIPTAEPQEPPLRVCGGHWPGGGLGCDQRERVCLRSPGEWEVSIQETDQRVSRTLNSVGSRSKGAQELERRGPGQGTEGLVLLGAG